MEKIRNLSIRKTIILYMCVNLIVCFTVSTIIIRTSEKNQKNIWWKYLDWEEYGYYNNDPFTEYKTRIERVNNSEMSDRDAFFSEICDFIQTWTMLIVSSVGIVLSVFLFYRNKIKEPLEILVKGSENIGNNDLDFPIVYENQDELGMLCVEFEKMRVELLKNNQKMWKMLEEEQIFRAAIAHDIRSPLAVLRGYQEMLLEFIPEEKLDKENIMNILESGMNQIDRIHMFADTILHLTKLEERELDYTSVKLAELKKQIEKTAVMILGNENIECMIYSELEDREIEVDVFVVQTVIENLISNASRYAEKEVTITLGVQENNLEITVTDDGEGFLKNMDLDSIAEPQYRRMRQDDLKHFGLGLYICRIYCEKHGGMLMFSNTEEKGAQVKAVFVVYL